MLSQEFGPRRSRVTRKPAMESPPVCFYQCANCGNIFQKIGYVQQLVHMECCNQPMQPLPIIPLEQAGEGVTLSYQITGGYNDNAVRVYWQMQPPYELQWLYLKTYTGGYMKYILHGKKPPMVFALADEDAFCYCDADPCLECVFWCKRGFTVYAFIKNKGLIEMPLDKANPYWQSGHEPE